MKTYRTKLFAIILFAIPLLLLSVFSDTPVSVSSVSAADTAATYKAKCMACHTAKASKGFDATKSDEDLVKITLEGKKGAKPPYMPGFAAKGMTPEEALTLVQYMKGLKAAS